MLEKHWFIFRGDHHLGPFSFQEILDKLKLDQIDDNELTWCEGHPDWLPLKDQPAIIEALQGERNDQEKQQQEIERQQLLREQQVQERRIAKEARLEAEKKKEQERLQRQAEAKRIAQLEAQRAAKQEDLPPPLPPLPIEETEEPPPFAAAQTTQHSSGDETGMTEVLMKAAQEENERENLEVVTFLTKEVQHGEGIPDTPELEDDNVNDAYDDDDTGEFKVARDEDGQGGEVLYQEGAGEDFSEGPGPVGVKFYTALLLSFVGLALVFYLVFQTTTGQRRLYNVVGRDKDALYNVMNRPFRGVPIHRLRPTKDLNSLWFATNFPDEAILYMTLKSIRGRSLGEGEVEVQGVARLQGGAALFDQLEVLKGEGLHVGEYEYEVKGVRVGLKGKLSAALGEKNFLSQIKFLRSKDQEFELKGTLLLSPYGSEEFSKRLKEQKVFVEKSMIRPLRDHKQRYQTFLGLLERLSNLYQSIMRRITKGKSIQMFEDRYNEEVGPFLRDLIIDCNRLYLSLVNLRPEQSKAYEELMNYGKDIGFVAAEMVTKTRKIKSLSKEKTDDLIDYFYKEVTKLREKGQKEIRKIDLKLAPYLEATQEKDND
jgi:hypothetical protein